MTTNSIEGNGLGKGDGINGNNVKANSQDDEKKYSKSFIMCLAIGCILWTAGALLWNYNETYYAASIVLLLIGTSIETIGFFILKKEQKQSNDDKMM